MKTGFTLTELMVVVAISSIVFALLGRFLSVGYPLSRVVLEQSRSTEMARLQLDRIGKALRELSISETGAYPLVAAEPQRLIFYSDVDSDDLTERIRYELLGTDLIRGIIKPSGDALLYNVDDEEVSVVSRSIRNGADDIFVYFSGDYPADLTPLTPADLTEVKYIEFRLLVDSDPDNDPQALELLSQVQLRNLKNNLGEEVNDE